MESLKEGMTNEDYLDALKNIEEFVPDMPSLSGVDHRDNFKRFLHFYEKEINAESEDQPPAKRSKNSSQ